MEFSSALDSALGASKARNSKAVRALLDIDALKASKNQTEDIRKAIEAVKAENDYLFESSEPIRNPVAPSGGVKTASPNDASGGYEVQERASRSRCQVPHHNCAIEGGINNARYF